MTHQGEENFKILNFPFGYKKLCILIEKSLSILAEKEHSSAYFKIKVLFFVFERDLFYKFVCRTLFCSFQS